MLTCNSRLSVSKYTCNSRVSVSMLRMFLFLHQLFSLFPISSLLMGEVKLNKVKSGCGLGAVEAKRRGTGEEEKNALVAIITFFYFYLF